MARCARRAPCAPRRLPDRRRGRLDATRASRSRSPAAAAGTRPRSRTACTCSPCARPAADARRWQRLRRARPQPRLRAHDVALHAWQKVQGSLRIRANVRGAKTTGIGLYVDGKVTSRDRTAPFTLRWNSQRVRDGRHRITLAAVASDGRVAGARSRSSSPTTRVCGSTPSRRPSDPSRLPRRIRFGSSSQTSSTAPTRQRRRRLARAHDRPGRARAVRRRRHRDRDADDGAVGATWDTTAAAGRPHARGARARERRPRRRDGDGQRDGDGAGDAARLAAAGGAFA